MLGTFPSAVLVGRWRGLDPTRTGSGNPGASNAFRTMGKRAGALVLVGDLCKGIAAAGLGLASVDLGVPLNIKKTAVVGHVLPATRGFRGGKGVATAAGVTLVLLPVPGLILSLVWVVVAKLSKTASVASLTVAVALPVGAAIAGRPLAEVLAFAACGVLVVVRHRSNIDRLLHGDEHTISRGRDADASTG